MLPADLCGGRGSVPWHWDEGGWVPTPGMGASLQFAELAGAVSAAQVGSWRREWQELGSRSCAEIWRRSGPKK